MHAEAPMRVAIFSDHFQPELGGIQDAVECLARGLAERGHQIDIRNIAYFHHVYDSEQPDMRRLYDGAEFPLTRRTTAWCQLPSDASEQA